MRRADILHHGAVCGPVLKWSAPLLLATAPALADSAEIIEVRLVEAEAGWTFHVTVAHADTGWDHYADGWQVRSGDTVLAHRTLTHPHVEEQPFTRSLPGIEISQDIARVQVTAHDTRHGWGQPFNVDLPR